MAPFWEIGGIFDLSHLLNVFADTNLLLFLLYVYHKIQQIFMFRAITDKSP